MIETIANFFKRPVETTKNETPNGFCPNCWGSQEYDKVIRELYDDKQIDVNNREANHAFIQKFVVERINGIHLKKGNSGVECPTCRTK